MPISAYVAPKRSPSEIACSKSSIKKARRWSAPYRSKRSLERVVQHLPLALGRLYEEIRLVRFAILGALGDAEQPFGFLELGETVADLAAVGLELVLVARNLLGLDDVL